MATAKTEEKKPLKKERTRSPAAGLRDKLSVYDKDPNYHYRWVRNDEGRIRWFQERGYEVVTKEHEVGDKVVDQGSQLGSAVTKFGGGTVTLVLMRILREWFDEDQAAKEDAIAATEATMKRPGGDLGQGAYGRVDLSRK